MLVVLSAKIGEPAMIGEPAKTGGPCRLSRGLEKARRYLSEVLGKAKRYPSSNEFVFSSLSEWGFL